MPIEGVGCHTGKGGGGRRFLKERKERTSEVTVRSEIIKRKLIIDQSDFDLQHNTKSETNTFPVLCIFFFSPKRDKS